jgi:predicted nucleic acid-binding protein
MSLPIILDASFVGSMVLLEPTSHLTRSLYEAWKEQQAELYAPSLLVLEVGTSIRKNAVRGLISESAAADSLAAFQALVKYITLAPVAGLVLGAWAIALKYRLLNLYDASYVALADQLGGEVWTADARMRRSMPEHAERIRVVVSEA